MHEKRWGTANISTIKFKDHEAGTKAWAIQLKASQIKLSSKIQNISR